MICDLRWPIYNLQFISFFHFSEIQRERDWERVREKKREIPWGKVEGSTEHRAKAEQSAICDLRSTIYDLQWGATGRATTTTTSKLRRRQQRRDRGLLGLVYWGLVLVYVLGILFIFFFFYKHLCVWFARVCFAFVLGFDFSASDDATWWVSFLCQRCDGFHFWFFVLVFFFFFLVENPWACHKWATCNLLGSLWAWLCYKFFFFFQILVQIFFGFFFFFAWKLNR